MLDIAQQSFDYSTLDADTRSFVEEKTSEIHRSLKRTAEEVIKVGNNLISVKACLKHGKYEDWLKSEFDMSLSTALRFTQVAIRFSDKSVTVTDLPIKVLYELAAPSTPDVVIEMVESGEIAATLPAIREAKQQVKVAEPITETQVVSMDEIFPGFKRWYEEKHVEPIMPVIPANVHPLEQGLYQAFTEVVERESDEQREIRREQAKENIARLREKGVDLPLGKYSCLVIDPPWPMQKIERDVRPNQVEFDYPTMNEDELKAFPLPDMAADNCHLYLWTTQKHLPLALKLAEHWGFKYQCLMTWVKNVGFTPFSWMYSTEHVLFCTRGSLPLLSLGKRLDFHAKVREHSRKPDEFYDLVKEVSPGPRIDIFSREQREGFAQYGNEVGKFV